MFPRTPWSPAPKRLRTSVLEVKKSLIDFFFLFLDKSFDYPRYGRKHRSVFITVAHQNSLF